MLMSFYTLGWYPFWRICLGLGTCHQYMTPFSIATPVSGRTAGLSTCLWYVRGIWQTATAKLLKVGTYNGHCFCSVLQWTRYLWLRKISDLWEKQTQLPTGNLPLIRGAGEGISSPFRNSLPPFPIKLMRDILETISFGKPLIHSGNNRV